ncbi:M4 family metallopeptidase [Actinoplanes sp. N902-109]|uniref:M4 family metallopeptidase n=1 Tax=Actinoplanes sp. (strain N902-109) TaxID=649831 RepID=UPI0003294C94|nr:M4 family metallopeptidase [Actinoplanes sp. N902-109]AGL19140.1 metalloprotease [Actinoplanes sp. N902-109]
MRRPKALPAIAVLATAAILGTTAQAAHAAPPSPAPSSEEQQESLPVTVAPATDTPALVDDVADPVDATIAPDKAAKAHLAGHKDRYKISDPAGTLTTASVETRGNRETVRLNQKYRGLPVFGAQYVVRTEKAAGKRTVTGTSGSYFTNLDVDTSVTPIPAAVAVSRAVDEVRKSLHPGTAVVASAPRRGGTAEPADLTGTDQGLLVMPTGTGVLARRVLVKGKDAVTGQPVLRDVYVGATNGVPLLSVSRIKSVVSGQQAAALAAEGKAGAPQAGKQQRAAGAGTASVVGQGTTLHGATVSLPLVQSDDGSYLMKDETHRAPDGQAVPITTWDARGWDYYDLMDGAWPQGLTPFAAASTTLGADLTAAGAVDAAWDAAKVYEWYRSELGRNSLDDAGMPINSVVGITYGGNPWVNAYWDGTRMVYGSGDDEYLPLAADPDVVGHEMTHGVVEHTASLVYAGQPGALNEAIADYFGNAIDVDASGTAMSDPQAALIGGDLCRTLAPAACALRDLDDGTTTADFQHLIDSPSMDDGGVHLNSTIVSGALWDLRQALGKATADKIVYRAVTDYLTPMSDFVDMRDAVIASARSFHVSKDERRVVQAAFDSRDITKKWERKLYGGADVLIDRLNTGMYADMRAGVADGWFAVPRADANRTEPTAIWVGRTDGKTTPYRISPDDGSVHSFPHTNGKQVVWLSIAIDPGSPTWETNRILSAPIGGGPVTELYSSPERIDGLGFDGDIVAWSSSDAAQGYLDVVHYLQGSSPTVHTLAHPEWSGSATAPSVKNGKISYVRYEDFEQPDANGTWWSLGVEVYDVATGRTTYAGGDAGAERMSYPDLSATGVAWMTDRDYGTIVNGEWSQGTYNDSIRLFDFAGRTSHLLFEENSPQAVRADTVALSDTTLTITEEAPVQAWTANGGYPDNSLNPKLKQYTFQGKYLGPASCSPGAQMYATAAEDREVAYMDSAASGFGLAYAKGEKSCK